MDGSEKPRTTPRARGFSPIMLKDSIGGNVFVKLSGPGGSKCEILIVGASRVLPKPDGDAHHDEDGDADGLEKYDWVVRAKSDGAASRRMSGGLSCHISAWPHLQTKTGRHGPSRFALSAYSSGSWYSFSGGGGTAAAMLFAKFVWSKWRRLPRSRQVSSSSSSSGRFAPVSWLMSRAVLRAASIFLVSLTLRYFSLQVLKSGNNTMLSSYSACAMVSSIAPSKSMPADWVSASFFSRRTRKRNRWPSGWCFILPARTSTTSK
mmetsp:Transcript_51221/g.147868  ORF Transcript_51221/g.147868 Transcript_51221/m.147868 type:complete len:263 (-) Transcript_51221:647-1435(-)